MTELLFVGLDVGGTSLKAGVVDDRGNSLSDVSLPTESKRGQEFGLERMCETIRAAVRAAKKSLSDIAAIGVATPGTMDIPAGLMLEPHNFGSWRNVPVRDHIAQAFQLPTAFQNDANAAAYGEFWAGAGKEANSLVMFTLGTGVGGGIIIGDGGSSHFVIEGQHSHGAELGHMKIEMTNPRQCPCGRWGCLEAYASATAVVKRTLEALNQPGAASTLTPFINGNQSLTARQIFDAAEQEDVLASKIVDDTAYYLAVGATNMMHTIDPDMIVYAGGMIQAGDRFLHLIRGFVKELAFPVPCAKTQLRYASLGTDAGYIGAAACGRLLYHKKKQ